MSLHEIVLPETKPDTEWIGGRALQKVSPTYSHAILQSLIGRALLDWLDAVPCGRVGTEWRFRVTPRGEVTRPLVPDVAFLSFDVLPACATRDELEVPLAAPTVAFEILSPLDRRSDVDEKISSYLSAGCQAVVIVDPDLRRIEVHDALGSRVLGPEELLTHRALRHFSLNIRALFARAAL